METLHSLHAIDTLVGAKGVTVLKGPKWYNLDLTEGLALCVCDGDGGHEVVGHATLFDRSLMTFSQVTDEMLADEHEESSRTKEGLMVSLARAYGGMDSRDLVTILTYWRTD